jgi:hypothetical protein
MTVRAAVAGTEQGLRFESRLRGRIQERESIATQPTGLAARQRDAQPAEEMLVDHYDGARGEVVLLLHILRLGWDRAYRPFPHHHGDGRIDERTILAHGQPGGHGEGSTQHRSQAFWPATCSAHRTSVGATQTQSAGNSYEADANDQRALPRHRRRQAGNRRHTGARCELLQSLIRTRELRQERCQIPAYMLVARCQEKCTGGMRQRLIGIAQLCSCQTQVVERQPVARMCPDLLLPALGRGREIASTIRF